MHFYNRYSPAPSAGISISSPSLTQQQFADEADINKLVKRYEVTGMYYPPDVIVSRKPQYGDFTGVKSAFDAYLAAEAFLDDAHAQFDELPSNVRSRFDNDPSVMLEFLEDPSNYDEAKRLGLIEEIQDVVQPREGGAVYSAATELGTSAVGAFSESQPKAGA